MTKENGMNDPMEKIIQETLRDKSRPRLSSGFAADVMESVEKRDSRKKITPRTATVLAIYWIIAGMGSLFILSGIREQAWLNILFVILTPVVFFLLAAPRGFVRLTEGFLHSFLG